MYFNYNLENFKNQEFLSEKKFKDYKRVSEFLSASYRRQKKYGKSFAVENCGTHLEFAVYENGEKKLHSANFCKVRLCPLCAWRRSLKIFSQVSRILDAFDNGCYSYLFLTLTVKNVDGNELSVAIDKLLSGYKKLMKLKEFKFVEGSFRALDVTFNKESLTYHPHIHCILAVPNSYFKSHKYLSQKKISELWGNVLSVDYDPRVDIRRFNRVDGREVAEVAKYAVKPNEYILRDSNGDVIEGLTDEVVSVLDDALHGRRLISFGGIFKKLHKELNLDDVENGDLIIVDGEKVCNCSILYVEVYEWRSGVKEYVFVEKKINDGG